MQKKKKICMIVQDKSVKGGIASVISGYYSSKLEENYDLIYVESYKDGNKFDKFIKAISGYIKFLKVIIIEKPDIIHVHSSFGASFYRKIPYIYLANIFNKPVINHIHGADFDTFYINASVKKKKLIDKIYNKCDVIIALSEQWKQMLSNIVSEEKIIVIQNYSVLHKDAIDKRRVKGCNNQVLFLGQIGHRKGCFDIPEVVYRVSREIPDVRFILAGDGEIDKVKDLLCQKGVEKNVLFPGWVRGDVKDKLLKESDLFFLPSYNEGMPMAVLDAMGYGLPIITTNVGGIPKIVYNGKNGYYAEPGNNMSFSEHIIELLSDYTKILEFGEKSYEIVEKAYSFETHIGLIENLYDKF